MAPHVRYGCMICMIMIGRTERAGRCIGVRHLFLNKMSDQFKLKIDLEREIHYKIAHVGSSSAIGSRDRSEP